MDRHDALVHSNKICMVCQNRFVQIGVVRGCMMAITGAFTTEQQSRASALHCVQCQNLDEYSFDMLYKNYCWAAIPDPIWTTNLPFERMMDRISSNDNNFMFLFVFERFRIESWFPFFLIINTTVSTVGIMVVECWYRFGKRLDTNWS